MNLQSHGLRTTIYKVDNLLAARDWYAQALGIQPYFDEPFYVGFNISGYELGLIEEKTASPKTTNVLSYWAVTDITDSYDIMCSHGAKELETPNDVGGGIQVALLKDPWENVIGLIYNPHFKVEYPKQTVVEWAGFELAEDHTEEQLLEASARLDREFLFSQKGFLKRELLKKSDTSWADLIYWASEADARAAFGRASENEAAKAYFELMGATDCEAPPAYYEIARY